MSRTVEVVTMMLEHPASRKLFAHQRSNTKKTFPGKYGLGVGGYVGGADTPYQAINEKLQQELRVSFTQTHIPRWMVSFEYRYNLVIQKTHVYHAFYSGNVDPNLEEFDWTGWLTINQIQKMLKRQKFCPDTALFFNHWLFHERVLSVNRNFRL